MNVTYDIDENRTQIFIDKKGNFDFSHDIGTVLLAVMISVLSFIGILGNVPVLIVFCKRKDRKASNTFIKVLAFLDLLVCGFVMPYSIVYEYHLVTSDVVCRLFEFLIHFCVASSNITLVAIASERYVAVCQISKKINVTIINRGVYGILFIGVLIAAPSVGTFAVVKHTEVTDVPCSFPHENSSGYFCHFTYTIMGHDIVKAYQVLQLCVFFLELVAIIVLYSIIYGVLWKKTQIRKSLTRRRESCALVGRQIIPIIENDVLLESNKNKNKEIKENVVCRRNSSISNETNKYSSAQTDNHIDDSIQNTNEDCSKKDLRVPHRSDSKVTFQNSLEKIEESDNQVHVTEEETKCLRTVESRSRQNSSFGTVDKVKTRRSYHRRTAKMLFLCTVIYFVTWLPFWFDIFGLTNSLLIRYLFFIGNATNPIVYGIVNKQVRRSVKRLFFNFVKTWCSNKDILDGASNTENVSYSGTSV